MKFLKFNRFGI